MKSKIKLSDSHCLNAKSNRIERQKLLTLHWLFCERTNTKWRDEYGIPNATDWAINQWQGFLCDNRRSNPFAIIVPFLNSIDLTMKIVPPWTMQMRWVRQLKLILNRWLDVLHEMVQLQKRKKRFFFENTQVSSADFPHADWVAWRRKWWKRCDRNANNYKLTARVNRTTEAPPPRVMLWIQTWHRNSLDKLCRVSFRQFY